MNEIMHEAAAVVVPRAASSTLSLARACALLAAVKTADEAKEIHDQASAVKFYLARKEAGSQAHADAWEITQRAIRRIGELTLQTEHGTNGRPRSVGGPRKLKKTQRLASLQVSKALICRWERLARLSEVEFADRIATGRERLVHGLSVSSAAVGTASDLGSGRAKGLAAVSCGSDFDGDERCAPRTVMRLVRKALGSIDLDAASSAAAQQLVRAKRFYSRHEDGLARDWIAPTLWLHPPTSDRLCERFVAKFIAEHEVQHFGSALLLVNSATETAWFHQLIERYPACLWRSRIPFLLGGVPTAGRIGQAFFYAGGEQEKFAEVFSEHGRIVRDIAGAQA